MKKGWKKALAGMVFIAAANLNGCAYGSPTMPTDKWNGGVKPTQELVTEAPQDQSGENATVNPEETPGNAGADNGAGAENASGGAVTD